jgi:translation initiation factor 2B subunit (eIF-2B alpha/beta/delta family)
VVVLDGTSAGGGPDQARRLCDAGVDARSQPDGRAPVWLGDGAVVVTGADAVGPARFVNAAGTRSMLELAAAAGVRAWLAADPAKDLPEEVLDDLLDRVRTVRQDGPGREWPVLEAIPLALVAERVDGRRRPLC